MQGPRAMPAPPARPPRHHRRVSSSDNGRRPSSVYSQDTRRHSNGHQRPISKLIRRDSLDNRPPARPPRPRESLDMSLFVDRTDASPVTAAMAALEQALGPMEQTPAVTEKAWMASPRRIPPPSVGPSTTTIAAAAPPLTSLVSSGTTKTTMGRRATRREDVRRIASLLGAEALSGVDVEAIVQMERNRPKTQEGQHRPARNSLILLDNLPPSRDIDLTPNVVSSAPTPEVGKARPTSAPSPSRKNTLFGKMTSKLHSRPHSHSSAPRQPATKPDIRRLNSVDYATPPTNYNTPATLRGDDHRNVFGAALGGITQDAFCLAVVGGEVHSLPIVIFAAVEELFKRGLCTAGLFRLPGDSSRIDTLAAAFDFPPLYGDHDDLSRESVHNVAGLFKRYLRELPNPVLDQRLTRLFQNACIDSHAPLGLRILAARMIIRLLPKRHLSLFIYLCAFLAQLPLSQQCHLDNKALGNLLGPALLAPRSPHIAGLGQTMPADNAQGLSALSEEGGRAIRAAQAGLTWILEHWASIGADFVSSTPGTLLPPLQSAANQPRQPVLHDGRGLGVSMGLPSPVVSSEAQIGLATPLSPESPIDPRQQEPPHMIATAIGEPPRSHHSSRSSASRHTSPSAPSFGSRSRRSSSGTGSSAHRRLSNDVPLPSAKHDPRDSETFDSTAAQTRRIVALEAELALAKKSATIVEDLRRQLAAEQAKRREEEDHLLREAKNDLERARREAEEEVRTLRSLIEKERVEREKRMVEMEREVVAATKARADKERRVSELEVELAKARSDGEEWQKKLSTIKAALGLA